MKINYQYSKGFEFDELNISRNQLSKKFNEKLKDYPRTKKKISNSLKTDHLIQWIQTYTFDEDIEMYTGDMVLSYIFDTYIEWLGY